MTGFEFAVVPPDSPDGGAVLRAYFIDIMSRGLRRPPTDAELAAEMREDPSDDLVPPDGLFWVARLRDDAAAGCVGLRFLPGGFGEVTRVFVRPRARGQGLGRRLLRVAEEAARGRCLSRLRLDTRTDLTEARRLYESDGYREVPPFNDGRWADHWYEKTIDPALRADRLRARSAGARRW